MRFYLFYGYSLGILFNPAMYSKNAQEMCQNYHKKSWHVSFFIVLFGLSCEGERVYVCVCILLGFVDHIIETSIPIRCTEGFLMMVGFL